MPTSCDGLRGVRRGRRGNQGARRRLWTGRADGAPAVDRCRRRGDRSVPRRSSTPSVSVFRASTCVRAWLRNYLEEASAFDAALAQLVVHFMNDAVAGIREMAPVTGSVASSRRRVWDGPTGALAPFWDAVHVIDPEAQDEALLSGAHSGHLTELFLDAGLRGVDEGPITVDLVHPTFEEWWSRTPTVWVLPVTTFGDSTTMLGNVSSPWLATVWAVARSPSPPPHGPHAQPSDLARHRSTGLVVGYGEGNGKAVLDRLALWRSTRPADPTAAQRFSPDDGDACGQRRSNPAEGTAVAVGLPGSALPCLSDPHHGAQRQQDHRLDDDLPDN